MAHTVVFFHAHPDDEALLTAGTMARAAAEGHRVVLVVATAGERGEADAVHGGGHARLGDTRRAELAASARALGVARTVELGYGDSGLNGEAAGATFIRTPVEQAAERLAAVLREEAADVLTTYDPAGGYGHPDHVRVHHVGARAAQLAGTPVVLEATVDRDLLLPVLRVLHLLRLVPSDLYTSFRRAYSPRSHVTHRVDVRGYATAKRAAMAAHASQASSRDGGDRTLAAFLRLPRPVFRAAFGREWYVDRATAGTSAVQDDIFATVRK